MILGAVLAGGRSSRFGSDKALALLEGRPLIAHVIDALASQVDAILVCGRQWQGLAWVADRPAGDLGPLGGINAALHYARDRGFDAVVTAPCDAPRLPPGLVTELGRGAAIVADLPVVGRWPAALADRLDAHLALCQDHSVRRWARDVEAMTVTLPVALENINRPQDLDNF